MRIKLNNTKEKKQRKERVRKSPYERNSESK